MAIARAIGASERDIGTKRDAHPRHSKIDITERAPNGEGCLIDEDCATDRCSKARSVKT